MSESRKASPSLRVGLIVMVLTCGFSTGAFPLLQSALSSPIGVLHKALVPRPAPPEEGGSAPPGPQASPESSQLDVSKILSEAEQLKGTATAESRQKAIEKYKSALLLWNALGDHSQDVDILSAIASIYSDLSEN